MADRYWCHLCAQIVNPIMEVEMKCPFCDSGFIEEMNSVRSEARFATNEDDDDDDIDLSERSLSMIAPFFLGMMEARARRRRSTLTRVNNESDSDQDHDLETRLRRRRRSTAIMQLLQNLSDNLGPDNETSERETESVILFNPANQEILLQATFDSNNGEGHESSNASLGDYLLGPGMEMLLQHLAENDPNIYGTPPAKKEAIDVMPTVKVEENLNCSVCLDDFEIRNEAKEMPCKHKFHSDCILPWLELHSTCPVCRFQIAAVESKASNESGSGDGDGGDRGNGSRSVFPWSVTGLYTSSRSHRGRNSSSNPSSSSTSESNSHEDEN